MFALGSGLGDRLAELILSRPERPQNLGPLIARLRAWEEGIERLLGIVPGTLELYDFHHIELMRTGLLQDEADRERPPREPAPRTRPHPERKAMTAAIKTEQLTKHYGSHRGIVEVDLEVLEGEAFGFLGPNGAGKTTMIRLLLDHIRPTEGKAFVFGIETTVDPVAIHKRLGYLPGEFLLYDRLTGAQTLEYFANLRDGVDPGYQAQLVERLDVDLSRRFKEYSKGNKQKIGLIIALQHRPDLLILDEPTSGLDPLVQQEFFQVIREAKAEGRTVFMSSHILSEVERTCDRVAIIREGRLIKVDRVEGLRDLAHHQVELTFAGAVPVGEFEAVEGVSDLSVQDHILRMRVFGPITPIVKLAARHEVTDFVSREPSLEETFLAEYGEHEVEAART